MSRGLTYKDRYDLERRPKARGRVEIPQNADLILADKSSSMGLAAFAGKTRIDCVNEALKPFRGRAYMLAFSSRVEELDCGDTLQAEGSTNLAAALGRAIELEPIHVLVMCDGEPNSKPSALQAASKLAEQCLIDTLYIGPETDVEAINFMKELAAVGHGRFSIFSLTESSPLLLEQKIDSLLCLPDPGSVVKL